MFDGQSRHWSWREVGYSSKTMIQSIPQNQPWSTSRKYRWRFYNGHHSHQTLFLKICGEISNMPCMQGGRGIFLSQKCSAKIPKAKDYGSRKDFLDVGTVWKLLLLSECELQSTKWQGSQTFAQGLFPFLTILKLYKIKIKKNLTVSNCVMSVPFSSVHFDINCKRLFAGEADFCTPL